MPRLIRTQREMEGELIDVWALVDPDDELEPWGPDDDHVSVGRPHTRADAPLRAAGRARFTVDVSLPGMLHAAVLRSRHAHAVVEALDLDKARQMPGVRAVIGPRDEVPRPSVPNIRSPRPLLTDEPMFVGEAIAAVAADTPEQAEAALTALAPRYRVLPFDVDPEHALRAAQRYVFEPFELRRGEAETELEAADVRIELTLDTPVHHTTPIEPHAAVAEWQGDDLCLWVSTQGTFMARSEIAVALGMPVDRIRVISEFVGGAFGSKLGAGYEGMLAIVLARVAGRPVRCVLDRHRELQVAGHRAASHQVIRLGAWRDGTLAAIETEQAVVLGVSGHPYALHLPFFSLYRCGHVTVSIFPVKVNLSGASAFRAPGVMTTITAFEQAMDELAGALDIDPLELRRRNHAEVDQDSGLPYSDKHLLACYERAAELSQWDRREQLRRPAPDGLLRGLGLATSFWGGAGGPPAHATMRMRADGGVLVVTGISDLGTGSRTAAQLVAAEALGISPQRIEVSIGDTLPEVYAPIAGGSGTVPSVMPAVRAAADKLRRRLLDLAGDVYEIDPRDLTLRDGRIRSSDQSLDRGYTDVTEKLGNATLEAAGSCGPNPDEVRIQTFGCQVAQVAVDAAIGRVFVERIWSVHDSGLIVNPLTATSQVEGGIMQGLGHALSEERVVDPTTGAPTTDYLDEYKIPTIADMPEITVEFISVPDARANHVGAKGLGEPPIIPTAAAIANAFAHASGRRATALPLTPQRVLDTLR
jgi:CO/xanthine dehydrogenase Mo-binding subunit